MWTAVGCPGRRDRPRDPRLPRQHLAAAPRLHFVADEEALSLL